MNTPNTSRARTHTTLFGYPGAGKGTYGPNIAERYNLETLVTSNLLRNFVAAQEQDPQGNKELARHIKETMAAGGIVSDDIIFQVLDDKFTSLNGSDIQFDGFPRTKPQARRIVSTVRETNDRLVAINLSLPREIAIERVMQRREEMLARGENLRPDDQPEVVVKRMDAFEQKSLPVIDELDSEGVEIVIIDVSKGSIQEINERIFQKLDVVMRPQTLMYPFTNGFSYTKNGHTHSVTGNGHLGNDHFSILDATGQEHHKEGVQP